MSNIDEKNKLEQLEKLEQLLDNLKNKTNKIYFLTYDTKKNPRAAIKYIYDMALTLRDNGYDANILVEGKEYTKVDFWLDEKYLEIPIKTIKDDQVEMNVDDIIVVPEYYSNALEQLTNVRAIKVILIQQKEFMFETLPIGSRWHEYGFDKCITTTEGSKKYIKEIFPESMVYVNPPFIDDIFKPLDLPQKPYIAISCRNSYIHRKLISEFYLKYPQLRWITFRDMKQLSYEEFAHSLRECMVALWVDDESTFGTFPLEAMKSGVPVVGKIPSTEPDWLGSNGMWSFDLNKMTEILATYVISWIDGIEIKDEVKKEIEETIEPYKKEIFETNTLSIFNSLIVARTESITKAMEKFKNKE